MNKRVFPMKMRLLSSVPDAGGENATTIDDRRKFKITTLEELVETELSHMKSKLATMGCEKELSRRLLELYEETLNSADLPPLEPKAPKKRKIDAMRANDK